ncbi:MAG: hypothetical protein ACFHVJ_12835 [Aestuariibacter sp.]
MKQINKFFIGSVASLLFFGQAVAEQNSIDKAEIKLEIAQQLNIAIAQIDSTGVEAIAKIQLDEMTFKQNVEQFLVHANYNEETKSVAPAIAAE